LKQINPDLVFTAVSCFVPSSPWQGRRGFEQIAQAVTGVMHVHSAGLPVPTIVSVLMNDYLTGYLGAIGTVAALAEREDHGGYWKVSAALTRCAMQALSIVESQAAEEYKPVTMQDLVDFAVDQDGPSGTLTRLAPTVAFSHTPSYALWPTNWPGTSPDTVKWSDSADDPGDMPHYPSLMACENAIRNLVPCNGIEDRGDGGGGLSLASPMLLKLVEESRKAGAPG
jgi:hypothetical protein